jgi:PAS domain S-box-containing protein
MRDPSTSPSASGPPAFAPAIGLREVLEAAPDLIFCCDAAGRFAWASSTFESFAGHRASDLVGQFATTIVAEPDRVRLVRSFRRQLRRGRPQSSGDYALLRPDGSSFEVTVRVRLYERADGERYFVGVARERVAPMVHTMVLTPEPAAEPVAPAVPASGVAATDRGEVELLEARVHELERQLGEAREGDRLKHEVLASLSQEIRPPMDAVFGTSATLLGSTLAPEQRRLVETIQASSQVLMDLVSDAYDHALIETGQMSIECFAFDLRVTAQQVGAALEPLAKARGLELDVHVEPLVPSRLKGDPGRLRQVLLNLAGNAIRHAQQGRIEIHMERESEDDALVTLMFRVTDPGVGRGAAQRAQMFRAEGHLAADPRDGNGLSELGLSVSRRLVRLMGGLVGVDELAQGGRAFWFRLSFEKQPQVAEAPAAAAVRLRGLRVLVADGMPTERRHHGEIMSAWGCDVVEAENGLGALDRIREAAAANRPFAVALADMGLEGLDGESLASAVRADRALDATRLVMTTRLGRPGDAQRARDCGFSGYLVKPLDASQLFDTLTELVGQPAQPDDAGQRPLVTRHSIAEARRARVRILLVEDDVVNQLVAQSALHRVGFHVDVASGGHPAIERTEESPWDLVLLNLNLSDLDAARTAMAIRARERGAWRTPIVGLCYDTITPEQRERCAAAGMDEVFENPGDLGELASAVERWTARALSRVPDSGPEEAPATESHGRLTVVSAHFDPPAAEREPERAPLALPELEPGPAIDLEKLNQASMGLPAMRTSMMNTFVSDAFPRLQRFEEALASGDGAAVEAEAVRLRRMSTTVGATGCTRLFAVAEEWVRAGRLDQVARLLPMIVAEVRRGEDFIARLGRGEHRDAA